MADTYINKYEQAIAQSTVTDDDAVVAEAVKKILDEHFAENNTQEVYRTLFNCIDLTTLKSTDSPASVAKFTEAVNSFEELFPSLEAVTDEINEQKEACRDGELKVILETGALRTARNIKAASILSLYSGADFLKTSTGKEYPGASLEATYIMAQCIKEYYEKTGTKVGFKAAGGIRTTEDAVKYYTVVKEVLGEEWLNNEYFRLGASSLANSILSDIAGHEVKHF